MLTVKSGSGEALNAALPTVTGERHTALCWPGQIDIQSVSPAEFVPLSP